MTFGRNDNGQHTHTRKFTLLYVTLHVHTHTDKLLRETHFFSLFFVFIDSGKKQTNKTKTKKITFWKYNIMMGLELNFSKNYFNRDVLTDEKKKFP